MLGRQTKWKPQLGRFCRDAPTSWNRFYWTSTDSNELVHPCQTKFPKKRVLLDKHEKRNLVSWTDYRLMKFEACCFQCTEEQQPDKWKVNVAMKSTRKTKKQPKNPKGRGGAGPCVFTSKNEWYPFCYMHTHRERNWKSEFNTFENCSADWSQ